MKTSLLALGNDLEYLLVFFPQKMQDPFFNFSEALAQ